MLQDKAPVSIPETLQRLPIWYELDEDNRVVAVSEYWDIHAAMYQSPGLLAKNVIGKALESNISGDVTQMFTDTMINSARVRGKSLVRRYRCDTPTHKREMEMELTPCKNGHIRVAHQLISETPWKHKKSIHTQTLIEKRAAQRRIKRCSMCNDLLDEEEWITQDEYDERHPDQQEQALSVYYGICPSCRYGHQYTPSIHH